jgi:hypothetical protein
MRWTWRGAVLPIATTLACLLLGAAPAQAANDPLGSGQTRLVLDKRFASFLKKDAVTLTAKAGATKKGTTYLLPVVGGSFDTAAGKGQIEQGGSLVFQSSRKEVPLRGITVKTKHSPLIAKVGGGQLKIATAAKLAARRAGFGSEFSAKGLKLTAKVATRLNKKLRPKVPFAEGQPVGTLVSNAQPQLATVLDRGRATVTFVPPFVAKLESHFVSLNPIFPAEHQGSTFTFPIALGGLIAPDGSAGTLRTAGSVELLQLGAGQVFWKELWLDLGARSDSAEVDVEPTPSFPGKLGRIGVFGLSGGVISSDPRARTLTLTGGSLLLEAQTAATLNEAFAEKKEVFKAGEAAASLTFTAQAQ